MTGLHKIIFGLELIQWDRTPLWSKILATSVVDIYVKFVLKMTHLSRKHIFRQISIMSLSHES